MMQSRALIHGLLTNGRHDRVGLFDHFWPETLPRWVSQGYPTRTEVQDGQAVSQPEDFHEVFGYDIELCYAPVNRLPLPGYEEVLQETEEWVIKRNGAGAAFKSWKHKSGTPEHIDFRMSSREVWEHDYRPHLLALDRSRIDVQRAREAQARARAAGRWFYYGTSFIWELARGSLGDLNLYQNMALDPDWLLDYGRVYTDFFKAHFRSLFEEVGLPDGIWLYEDLGFRGRLFASPRMFASLIFPYETELVEFFHSFGLPVVLHSCGDVTRALPLIVEACFDGLQPMEVKAGCDPLAFAERYHDRLAFIGGLDVRVLESNDRPLIRKAVTGLIEGMKQRGARYVFHSDHSLTPLIDYDSYRCAMDTYREHMRY